MLKLKLNILQKFILSFCFSIALFSCTTEENKSGVNSKSETNDYFQFKSGDSETISDIKNIDKNSQIATDFINEISRNSIDTSVLDLDDITQILFYDYETTVISIGYKHSSDKIIAYEHNDEYVLMQSTNVSNNYEITTIDGNNFIDVVHFPENKNAEITKTYDNNLVTSFSDSIYTDEYASKSGDVCCRKRGYVGCVQCSTFDNGLLNVLIGALVPELAVAVLVSCIGAGPNAWC